MENMIKVRVPESMLDDLKTRADKEDTTVSEIVRDFIERGLADRDKKAQKK